MVGRKAIGIIIGKRNFGESDKIITVYTKEEGKLKLLAHGTRKLSSKRIGTLDLINLIKFVYFPSDGLGTIGQVDAVESFGGVKNRLERAVRAYYLCEVVDLLTVVEQENSEVFDTLLLALKFLGDGGGAKIDRMLQRFEAVILQSLGFWSASAEVNDLYRASLRLHIERIAERRLSSPKLINKVAKLPALV